MYKRLHKELRKETDNAREDWWKARCDELIEYDKRDRSDLLYYEMSRLTETGKTSSTRSVAINDRSGELLIETKEVRMRWKEYIEKLNDNSNKLKIEDFDFEEEGQVNPDEIGPDLLTDEVCALQS